MDYLELKETEAKLKAQKSHNIKYFLENTNSIIEYNGEIYLIYRDQKLLTTCSTTGEIHLFILGWLNSNEESEAKINDLNTANLTLVEQNENNIKMYEQLIKGMGGEPMPLPKE